MTIPAETVSTGPSWLTKQQAADEIGVTTKTIEKLVKAGQIRQGGSRSSSGRHIVIYHPGDVAAVAAQRRSTPFPQPRTVANSDAEAPAETTAALVRRQPATMPGIEALITALRSAEKPASEKVFLTIPEAAAMTGLTQAYIRRLCQKRKLKALRDGGWKIRRKALLAL